LKIEINDGFLPIPNHPNPNVGVFYLSIAVLNRNTAVIFSNLEVQNPITEVFHPNT